MSRHLDEQSLKICSKDRFGNDKLDQFYLFIFLFFTVLSRPKTTQATQIFLLGYKAGPLRWETTSEEASNNTAATANGYIEIHLPSMSRMQHVQAAWVLKMTKVL